MTAKKLSIRPLAVLLLPRSVPALVTHARSIVKAVTGNPLFVSPMPPLATVTTSTDDLLAAESTALSRVKGAVAVRDEKRAVLVTELQALKNYVQRIADLSPENAISIIESAGLGVKKAAARKPRTFEALLGAVSGTAKLLAPSAGPRSSYEWQYSTDGATTWLPAAITLQATTTVDGLTPGASVEFRYRPITKSGKGDWSQTVLLIMT